MKRMIRGKLMSVFLTLVMVVGLLPVLTLPALADVERTTTPDTPLSIDVPEIFGEGYDFSWSYGFTQPTSGSHVGHVYSNGNENEEFSYEGYFDFAYSITNYIVFKAPAPGEYTFTAGITDYDVTNTVTIRITVEGTAPTVTAISPVSGPVTGGTSVTITGTSFTGATGVTIGGVSATGLTVVNDTTITATTPAGTAGAKDVAVTTPGGTGTGTELFTYVAAPEIDVKGNSSSIASGDATPDTADHTDFGSAGVNGGSVQRTFTIYNTGTDDLTLSGDPKVSISGTNASDFTVSDQPVSPVSAGGSTTFAIIFDPPAAGIRTADVTITNNDSDEGTYTFSIQGTGLSSDASLLASSTVKGQTVASLGTPGSAPDLATAGSVSISAAKAADTAGGAGFATLFETSGLAATVKAVKYAAGTTDFSGFEAAAAYAGGAIDNGDFFLVRVTAEDGATVQYYKITVTVAQAPLLVANEGLTVNEGTTGTVTSALLLTTDADTADAGIMYTVGTAPVNGTLKKGGAGLSAEGTFTQADIAGGLITYAHDGGDTASDSFTFTVSDGINSLSAETFSITVNPANDAPALSVTALNPAFTEGGSAVSLFSGASVSTVEAGQAILSLTLTVGSVLDSGKEFLNIDGAKIALTNGVSGTTALGGIDYSVSVSGGVATVTLSKAEGITAAAAQTLINGMTYQNDSEAPTTAAVRTVTLTSVQDNGGTANGGTDTTALSAASTVTVADLNDAPVVTASGGSTAFIEGANAPSVPVAVDAGITVSDADTMNLAGATVSITGNYQSGADALSFDNTDAAAYGNISGTFDAGTGALTLTSAGAATLAQWQSALRAVTYTNTSDNPNTSERTITFIVSDGDENSSPATKTVTVAAVNDVPTDITLVPSSILASGTGTNAVVGTLGNNDPDTGDTFTYGLVAGTGDTDNGMFNVGVGQLRTNDFLAAGTYSVRVQVSDGTVAYAKALTVTVTNHPGKALTADTSDDDVDHDIVITFATDSTFENAVSGISFNGTALTATTDYVVGSGTVTLKPGGGNAALRTPATADVVVTAAGYEDSVIAQTITAGAVNSLEITAQPVPGAETGDAFATQPVVTLKDQYGNICANGPSLSGSVTASATAVTGAWTIGGTVTKNAADGVAAFNDLTCTLNTPGSGKITFTSGSVTADSAEFTIPERDSAISPTTASFDKDASASGYQDIVVTVTLNGNTLVSIKNGGYTLAADIDYTLSGDTCTIKKEYLATFSTGSANLVFEFNMGADRVLTVTVSGSTSSHSGGGGSSTPKQTTYHADVKTGDGGGSTLPVTVDKNTGSASVEAGSQDNLISDGKAVVITVPSIPGVSAYTVGIPAPDLSATDAQGSLTVETDNGTVTVPSNMLTGVEGANGNKAQITIEEGDKSGLPEDVKAAIGDRPLVQLTLSIDGRQTDWSNPGAPVTVSIPYTPAAEELANPESIVVWYIDGSGNAVCITNGRYDPATGAVTVEVTHFSDYAVVYNPVGFHDVAANAWYYRAVSFITAREITDGTGDGNYSPDTRLTRGQFLVLLMRAYGIAPDTDPADNFSDAGDTYYTGYLAAAKQLGISTGVGENKFAPGQTITRQEMFTLLYNALKGIGQLPQGDSGKVLSDFTDAGQVDAWAKDAMMALVETGAVGGSAGALNPLGTTTRAEMAQVLYNLLSR